MDASTWLLLLFMVLVCIWPVLLDGDWIGPVIVAAGMLMMFIGLFLGTYVVLDGHGGNALDFSRTSMSVWKRQVAFMPESSHYYYSPKDRVAICMAFTHMLKRF